MVGCGPLKGKIVKKASEYHISIKLLDRVSGEDLLSLYQSADLFVLPSVGEAFGLVLAEAMACGCSCIANTSGASPELLGNKELLVEPSNPITLAEMIVYFLQNQYESQKTSEYLRQRANTLFSVDKMTNDYYELYKTAV